MRTDRVLRLAEWGFNVPFFIENPCSHYGRDTYLIVKSIFLRTNHFALLATRRSDKSTQFQTDMRLADALLRVSFLEDTGYDVILMEHVPVAFKGFVKFSGNDFDLNVLCIEGQDDKIFVCAEDLRSLKCRHIVRELFKVQAKMPVIPCKVEFIWTTDFIGVKGSRLIVTNYDFL